VTGQALWTLASSAGLVALLAASQPAFAAVRLAGAAYLVVLGLRGLWSALRPASPGHDTPARPRLAGRAAYLQGVVSNLGNPKAAVFFTSLLPQFVPAGHAPFLVLLGLGLVFCTLTLVWLSAYAFAVARAGHALRRPVVRRALDGLTGAVLVAFGLRLASAHR
jgi:threonine/homoserine/homoserine lactone efflux protein